VSHRKHVAALGALLTAVSLTACGSTGASSTAAQPSGSTQVSSSPTASPAPQAKLLTKTQLTAAMLPLSQMPAGWSVDTSDSTGGDKTFCNYKQPHVAKVQVSRDFQKGGGLTASIASVGLRQYASADDAAASFDAMEQALQTCHQETYQGSVLKYSAMSVDKTGDRSLGVRIESDGATILQQFTLDGPALISVGTGGLTDVNADTAAQLLRDQVARYEATATR
jgi:hypothetical protein